MTHKQFPALKTAVKVALFCGASAFAAPAFAQTTDMPTRATVNEVCEITTTSLFLDFGTYDPVVANASDGTDLDAEEQVGIRCSVGSLPGIGITYGAHAANAVSTTRALQADNNPTSFLDYELYQPDSGAPNAPCTNYSDVYDDFNPLWVDEITDTLEKTYNICGRVPKGQSGAVRDEYNDTVTVGICFGSCSQGI